MISLLKTLRWLMHPSNFISITLAWMPGTTLWLTKCKLLLKAGEAYKEKTNIWQVATVSLSLTHPKYQNNSLQRKFKADLTFGRQTMKRLYQFLCLCKYKEFGKIFFKDLTWNIKSMPSNLFKVYWFHCFASGFCHPSFVMSHHGKAHFGFEPGAMA